MMKYKELLRAAEQMIADFPADWKTWKTKVGVKDEMVDNGFKIDFYLEMTEGDK